MPHEPVLLETMVDLGILCALDLFMALVAMKEANQTAHLELCEAILEWFFGGGARERDALVTIQGLLADVVSLVCSKTKHAGRTCVGC